MNPSLRASFVAIQQEQETYAKVAPFHPAAPYPEYPFATLNASDPNPAYAGVRTVLRMLGMDAAHYDTPAWNPLGELVAPGDTVLLKPNLIRESHELRSDEWAQVITHGSVVRAVLDYVFIATRGKGRIIIADGPDTASDFDLICKRTGLCEIAQFYRAQGLDVALLDLRRDRWFQKGDVICRRIALPGDPAGYATVELGGASAFANYRLSGRFYGADYDIAETASFHTNGRHAYVLCRSALDADVVINLPKLKTHKKTGVTLSLKNMVGINGYRNCLPHHTLGTPDEGGDEFAVAATARKVESRAIRGFKRMLVAVGGTGGSWARAIKRGGKLVFGDTNRVIRSGNWHGNDTTWRMTLDLNKVLFYFNGEGRPRRQPLRYLTIVDGIVAGEGNGPMCPDAVQAGLIVGGLNPVAVDTVCATLMGFDYQKLPVVAQAWIQETYPLVQFAPDAVQCASNVALWCGSLEALMKAHHLGFQPHMGWLGYIERRSELAH